MVLSLIRSYTNQEGLHFKQNQANVSLPNTLREAFWQLAKQSDALQLAWRNGGFTV